MLTFELLSTLLVRLQEKEHALSEEIQRITSEIKSHREKRRTCLQRPRCLSSERRKFHVWRRTSFQLHHRRSELKTQRELIRTHIHAIFRKLDEMEGNRVDISEISNMDVTGEPVSAGA